MVAIASVAMTTETSIAMVAAVGGITIVGVVGQSIEVVFVVDFRIISGLV